VKRLATPVSLLLLLQVLLGTALSTDAVGALFTDTTSVPGNTFTAAASFGGTPMRLATGSYNGNDGSNRSITGLGFQPDLVFVKCDCGEAGIARTSTMVGNAAKRLNSNGGLQSNLIRSLIADGFRVGDDDAVNKGGDTYYWSAFKAGDELELGTYAGDGSDNRSITGVGFQPVWVATFGDGNDSVFRPATLAGDNSYGFTGTSKLSNRIQALEADGFQIGSNADVNLSSVTYHYVAWKASANVTQSSYAGNGADNRSITGIGFQPLMAWVKRDPSAQAVWRPQSLAGDETLRWNATATLANRIQAFEVTGFQIGSNGNVNFNGDTYHHIAFKDGGP